MQLLADRLVELQLVESISMKPCEGVFKKRHQAVVEVADLLEEVGYANLTIQAIADRVGVSNKTIYRWWSNKVAVVMEAFAFATADIVAILDTGSLRADLLAFIQVAFVAHHLNVEICRRQW
jgi:AcrR family transcriptional regulator